MSIAITPSAPSDAQLQQIDAYILSQAQRSTFNGTDICFLPPSTINSLTTLSNIQTICAQDPGLAAMRWPSHSREHFAEKVFKHGKKCFVLTTFAELGMVFLIKLLNIADDRYLPITELNVIVPEYRTHLETFTNSQAAVCAPILTVGVFDQKALFKRSLPFLDVKIVRESQSGNVYDVTFHHEHLRLAVSVLSKYTGRMKWSIKVFEDQVAARRHLIWDEGKFGFSCEDEYYLCY
ncbi:hypothetical protein BKA63DRAFT_573992 [Paraphoma chrysanthemicola]|nr:hypothetical protein BKA63DRAFT_573992 [Paraphoma chrysanthemicola]